MNNATLAARLAESPLFAALEDAALQSLVARARLRRFTAGEIVLYSEDEARFVYALLSGSVRVFHCSPAGLEVVVKLFKPPAVFGEMEVIVGIQMLESVAAIEPAEIVLIPGSDFIAALETNHALALGLLRDVCARLCIASHNEKALAFNSVRSRLASFLVSYAQFDSERVDDGLRIRLPMTQDDMANALGVTRRAVAKEIRRWQEQGVIGRSAKRYVIRDLERLNWDADPLQLGVAYSIGQPLIRTASSR